MSVLYQINSTLAISRLKNFETNTNVVVDGYAIQADGLESAAPSDVWTAAHFS